MNYNKTGNFSSADIEQCKSIPQLFRWKSVLHNDIGMLKNSLDMHRRQNLHGELDKERFFSRRMALTSQTTLLAQLECKLGELNRRHERLLEDAYKRGWDDAKAEAMFGPAD